MVDFLIHSSDLRLM